MAERYTRSMSAALDEGCTDGLYRKVVTDRGGVVEDTTYRTRRDLHDTWFGIHEARAKTLPDGRVVSTPDFVLTPPAHLP